MEGKEDAAAATAVETLFLPQRWSHCDVISVAGSLRWAGGAASTSFQFQDFKPSKWAVQFVVYPMHHNAQAAQAGNNLMHEVHTF